VTEIAFSEALQWKIMTVNTLCQGKGQLVVCIQVKLLNQQEYKFI